MPVKLVQYATHAVVRTYLQAAEGAIMTQLKAAHALASHI